MLDTMRKKAACSWKDNELKVSGSNEGQQGLESSSFRLDKCVEDPEHGNPGDVHYSPHSHLAEVRDSEPCYFALIDSVPRTWR